MKVFANMINDVKNVTNAFKPVVKMTGNEIAIATKATTKATRFHAQVAAMQTCKATVVSARWVEEKAVTQQKKAATKGCELAKWFEANAR